MKNGLFNKNQRIKKHYLRFIAFALAGMFVFAFPVNTAAAEFSGAFTEYFDGDNPRGLRYFSYGTGRLTPHAELTEIEDGILRMAIDENEMASPWQGRNYTARQLSHFGRYSARLRIPSSENQPNVGAVVGFYTFYNDEWSTSLPPDINNNGIFDNSEIDFEWLIANPEILYLTIWTDFQSFPEGDVFGRVSRTIHVPTGTVLSTSFGDTWGVAIPLTGLENYPETVQPIPGFDASRDFHTYGFDWKPHSVRFWILNPENPEEEIVLWYYQGPMERITQKPAYLSFNIWHTNNWPVTSNPNSIEAPTETFWAELDWISFEPFDYEPLIPIFPLAAEPVAAPAPAPEPTPVPAPEAEPAYIDSNTAETAAAPNDANPNNSLILPIVIIVLVGIAGIIGFVWFRKKRVRN